MLIPHLYGYAVVIVMGQHLGILLGEYLEIDSIDLEFVPAMGVNDLDTLNGIKETIEPEMVTEMMNRFTLI